MKESDMKTLKLKVRKVNTDWYQIDVEQDRLGFPTKVVAIFRVEGNEWSVNDGEPKSARRVDDLRRYVFVKLGSAKVFALDFAESLKNETRYPRLSDSKYHL